MQLSAVADLCGVPLGRVYELFRLRSAPAPVGFVGSVRVFDLDEAVRFVRGVAADDLDQGSSSGVV